MAGTGIINIGIATVDAIGRTINTFPDAMGLEMFEKLDITTGGCAVNCAIDLGKMGIRNSLVVKVGKDMLGDFVLSEAAGYGVDTSHCLRDDEVNSPFTFVAVDETGERRFFHTVGTNGTFRADEIDVDFVCQHEYCYLGGMMVMPAMEGEPLAPILRELRSRDVKTVLDTVYVNAPCEKWREVILPMLDGLSYFVPSEPEAQAITGMTDPAKIAKSLKDQGAENVVVKLGEKGVYYLTGDGENGFVPAYRVENVVDTTGAGDSWDAGFLAGLYQGWSIEQSCRLGNATAAHCIQAAGASTGIVSLDEIRSFQAVRAS